MEHNPESGDPGSSSVPGRIVLSMQSCSCVELESRGSWFDQPEIYQPTNRIELIISVEGLTE